VKVGDLIKCKARYRQRGTNKFLVIGVRNTPTHGHQVRSIRILDGFKTRWSMVDGWEVISASR